MSTNNPPRETNKHLVFGQPPKRWTGNLEGGVPPIAAQEGRNYFYARSIDIRSGSREHAEAWVPGLTAKSVVKIGVQDETVLASCTCAGFRNYKNVCSHIWGVLLTCERKGYLGRIGEIQDPVIEPDHDAVFDLEAGENGIQDQRKTPTPPKAPKPPSKPKTEPWKEHFAALRSAFTPRTTENNERDRRVIYIIDPAESVSRKGLFLRAASSNRKKNGEWGKPAIYERSIRDAHQLDPADQNILGLLSGSKDVYGYYASNPQTEYRLPAASQQLLVPILCATGRCYLAPLKFSGDLENMSPLVWDDGPPWQLLIQIRSDESSASYKINARLSRGGSAISAATPLLLVPGLVFFKDRVSRFDDSGALEWGNVLRRNGTLSVPFASRPELLSEMASFPALPPLATPEELRIEQRNLDRPPVVKIRPPANPMHSQSKLRCEVLFDYGGIQVSEANAAFAIPDTAADRYFARDRGTESAALAKLAALGLRRAQPWEKHRWELASSKLPAAVRSLVSEGWQVEAEGKLYRRAGSINIEVRSGIDWFDLEGSAEFEGAPVQMPELLKAIARGENMVRLDDGSFGVVPEDWVKRYGVLAKMGHTTNGELRFGRHQAGLLDALLASEPAVSFDAGFLRVREQLASFAGLQPVDPGPAFQGTLRDYQREGLGWLHFLRRFGFGGCLADDMGLGKTVQVLAMLDSSDRRGPALVVVPRSLVFNWKQEVMRFAPHLRVLDLTGNGRKDQWREIPAYEITLSTYGTLRRDAALLKDIHFDTVVLDEAQTVKNPSTESAKAARLLKADHRLVMTGTPVENRIDDLWSLFEFLNPGMLGTAAVFRTHAAATDDSVRILSQVLRPFILRRTKEQVARELPPKTEQTIYCELEPDQRRLYDELRDHYRDSLLGRIDEMGIEKSRMHILEALLRLRQAACHPGLIDKSKSSEPSAKIDALLPQLQEVIEGGHKVLVFSQFTSLLAILRQRLDAEKIQYEYLDGRTRDRQGRVQRFQEDPNCRIFLISLKAGGLGLNLTSAEYVFLLDPWWNPAVEAQAIDRSHRIGQSHHVFAYRLIARDTIEEKVLDLQKTKREIAGAIITADNSVIAGLSREHLELLLS